MAIFSWFKWRFIMLLIVIGQSRRNRYIALATLTAACVSGYFIPNVLGWASSKSVQEWMGVVYPILTAAVGTSSVLMFIYWYFVRPVLLVLANALLLFTEFLALLVLTISTGPHPVFDINELRVWVVNARVMMLVSSAWMNIVATQIIIEHVTKGRIVIDVYAGEAKDEYEVLNDSRGAQSDAPLARYDAGDAFGVARSE